eukprot:comp20937_c0_seq1/m.27970 comp20937_c0_seq1/g.27970  ORF comp20937_c0_seq1/g.27970 comp20937_c0_seq1/m.27970 type:complete len:260 (-) comp20937_c0_seq1:569-1348(-)
MHFSANFFALAAAAAAAAASPARRSGRAWPTGLTWCSQAYLFGSDCSGVDVVEVDTFYSSEKDIKKYKSNGQKVLCYMSAGTLEQGRPDRGDVPSDGLSTWSPYHGERWFNVMNWESLKDLMENRLNIAKEKGCDAVEADNMDCFEYDGCVPGKSMKTKGKATVAYAKWLVTAAHSRGMAIGLKNAFEILPELVDDFDFAVNESCPRFNQCDVYAPFRKQGKAVFGAEYSKKGSGACDPAKENGISMLYRSGSGYARCW